MLVSDKHEEKNEGQHHRSTTHRSQFFEMTRHTTLDCGTVRRVCVCVSVCVCVRLENMFAQGEETAKLTVVGGGGDGNDILPQLFL